MLTITFPLDQTFTTGVTILCILGLEVRRLCTNASIKSSIPMPNLSSVGPKRNVDTLDFRNAFGYTYDTLAVIGVGLDATGSMNALTPDPMTTTLPDVTKWEAGQTWHVGFFAGLRNHAEQWFYLRNGRHQDLSQDSGCQRHCQCIYRPGYGWLRVGNSFSRAALIVTWRVCLRKDLLHWPMH